MKLTQHIGTTMRGQNKGDNVTGAGNIGNYMPGKETVNEQAFSTSKSCNRDDEQASTQACNADAAAELDETEFVYGMMMSARTWIRRVDDHSLEQRKSVPKE